MSIEINFAARPSRIKTTSEFKKWLYNYLEDTQPVAGMDECHTSIRDFILPCLKIVLPYDLSPKIPGVEFSDNGLVGGYKIYPDCISILLSGAASTDDAEFQNALTRLNSLRDSHGLIEECNGVLSPAILVDDDDRVNSAEKATEKEQLRSLKKAFPELADRMSELLSAKAKPKHKLKIEIVDKTKYYQDVRIQVSSSEEDAKSVYPAFNASVGQLTKLISEVTNLEVRLQFAKLHPNEGLFGSLLKKFFRR